MSQWKFQLLPSKKDALGVGEGFRMDSVAEQIEREMNEALPYRFKFHKIGKIVIWLGPRNDQEDYVEQMGVSLKLYENFCADSYIKSSDEQKQELLKVIIRNVFNWFSDNFDDSEFFVTKVKSQVVWVH
ncbi:MULTISPECIES: hypothetical protein [unclassified Colwellia]|uniref:hypothetical protein n=1 Tax=unclassified Colwellia TaxID=196834 RepID=UPI0015F5AD08|nr:MULTISPECIES: hypothetical protein [unclassified Colwellia]MBA6231375.1 hypothetical protein [Colwellia sp. MB02u-7]MBA6235366.1 hypothetical protein [Colwellia sp. MB02u-11]MBA6297885.1 hypothetical protein [Colwellia sp. MB3u-22]MBA6309402.1 hypothetical protein [Colwellia sp. MB3u-64]